MYGRKNRGKRSSRRVVVTLLTFVMLLSMCFPGMMASAGEMETTAPSESEESILETTGAGIAADSDATENTEQTETTGVAEATGSTEATDATDGTDATEETSVEPTYLEQLNAYYEQAVEVGAGADNSVYAEIYNGTMAVYAAAGSPSAETDPEIYNAVGMIVTTLQGYGYDPYAVSTLAEERKQSFYKGDCDVYWDATDGTASLDGAHIQSITLNGDPVTWGDSDLGSGWTGTPSQVEDYYTSASTSNEQTVKLSITPDDGYYVTRITVVCCPMTIAPYNCATWSEGLAYDQEMTISAGGTLTIDLSSVAFCHNSNQKEDPHQYFILVQVAPLPSPLYVEYDYGEIVSILTNAGLATTPFDTPNAWTAVGSANDYYGSFVETDDLKFKQTEFTQYMYRYAEGDEDDAADWTHTSNSVTEAAKLAAASAGYYFTGWKAQYYEECTATEVTNPTYNKYDYAFSEAYGNPVYYAENVGISMVTNVQLVAQWEPVKLNVKKIVSGLEDSFLGDHTYGLTVYYKAAETDEWTAAGTEVTLTVTDNGEASAVAVSPAKPGYYMVKETSGNSNLTVDNTTMYIKVSDGGEVSVSQSEIAAGTFTNATLTVTNTYSSAQPKIKLVKKWLDADGNELTGDATANLPAVTFHLKDASGNVLSTQMVNYNGSWTTICDVPDDLVSVTEVVPDGYKQVGDIAVTTENDTDNQIFYTIYTATNQQDTADITISKTVSGNMGDINKSFEFTATLQDANGNALTFPAPEEGENYTVTDNVANFSLAHGGSIIIDDLPIGSVLTVNETNATAYEVLVNNEEVKAKGVSGNATGSASITADTSDNLAYENINEALIDTGLELTTFPFILLFCTAAGLGAVLLSGKRRYRF